MLNSPIKLCNPLCFLLQHCQAVTIYPLFPLQITTYPREAREPGSPTSLSCYFLYFLPNPSQIRSVITDITQDGGIKCHDLT
jgi:hypothetical protein